jgi:hypothetical protein
MIHAGNKATTVAFYTHNYENANDAKHNTAAITVPQCSYFATTTVGSLWVPGFVFPAIIRQ